jgi:hypothetical protein
MESEGFHMAFTNYQSSSVTETDLALKRVVEDKAHYIIILRIYLVYALAIGVRDDPYIILEPYSYPLFNKRFVLVFSISY